MLCLALLCTMLLAAGCVMPYDGSIYGAVMKTRSAMAVGDTEAAQTKVGESMAEGIILFATGDASIKAACDDAGITRIHHVDSEELNVLNIYCKQIIRVYGE
jgi:hypothetical protein